MDKNQFRDMCAAMALQGLITRGESRDAKAIAARAMDIGEAMVAERERRFPFEDLARRAARD